MCGIAGILGRDGGVEEDALRRMATPLTHRGPDDEGVYVDPQGRAGLAFRRLSIIDLDGGRQPISNELGTIWVVFNGEIYNYRALRDDLAARGHRFRTASDSETIVHLYEEFGERCFERLSGMFAIAIWDEPAGRLLLARDRLGKKPLLFARRGTNFYFASEAKAILALPGSDAAIDPQALHEYFLFQYIPAPRCIFRDFAKLLPAHYAIVTPDALWPPVQTAYWASPQPARFSGTYDDARERIGELLESAVRKRLMSDVPLGAFLSGGMDSSVVVALMRRLGVSPLRTFSIGFTDPRYDETRYARQIAAQFQTEHHEEIVTPRAVEILDTLSYLYDEPFGDSSAIPTYYVSRAARRSIKVALTGDGGDEVFGGYDRYVAAQLAARLDRLPTFLRNTAAAAGGLLPRGRAKSRSNRAARFLISLSQPAWRRYFSWVNVILPESLADGYQPRFRSSFSWDEPLAWFRGLFESGGETGDAQRGMRADLVSYLPYDLLTKVDVASMGCGLECRAPLLDHELIEFALSLPVDWKIRGGRGKRILRDWAAGILPPSIRNRGKMGFGVPIGEWFRGELRDRLRAALLSGESICREIFRPEWLNMLLEEHLSARKNHEHALWLLLMLDSWQKRWRVRF